MITMIGAATNEIPSLDSVNVSPLNLNDFKRPVARMRMKTAAIKEPMGEFDIRKMPKNHDNIKSVTIDFLKNLWAIPNMDMHPTRAAHIV